MVFFIRNHKTYKSLVNLGLLLKSAPTSNRMHPTFQRVQSLTKTNCHLELQRQTTMPHRPAANHTRKFEKKKQGRGGSCLVTRGKVSKMRDIKVVHSWSIFNTIYLFCTLPNRINARVIVLCDVCNDSIYTLSTFT